MTETPWRHPHPLRRAALIGLGVLALLLGPPALALAPLMSAPRHAKAVALAPLDAEQVALRDRLGAQVERLATEIGPRERRGHRGALEAAAAMIRGEWEGQGYAVVEQPLPLDEIGPNLSVTLPGASEEIVVVGAHYDTVVRTPGADDNASGVAALLELSRSLAGARLARTVRFEAWTNEEPPWFKTEEMGSLVSARAAAARGDRIVLAISLESIGRFSTAPRSHHWPFPFSLAYPNTATSIGIFSHEADRALVASASAAFDAATDLPWTAAAAPTWIAGIDWSDHWSYWQAGYPGLMVTDAPILRNPDYHEPTDTAEKLDLDRMTRVVVGVEGMVRALAGR